MKQLFLLILIVASTISVSAQKTNRGNDRNERYHYKYDRNERYDLNDRYKNNNQRNRRELQRQLNLINRDYDRRINSIQKKPFVRSNVKARKIRELELERRMALNQCRDRFSGRRVRA